MKLALIVVDYQVDFAHPDGALSVPRGLDISDKIDDLSGQFPHVILTQDWHTPDDPSFKKQGGQWPSHCVAGTPGAEFYGMPLAQRRAMHIIRKRRNSAFDDTGLASLLVGLGIDAIELCGLATDYCVFETALDARRAGFRTTVHLDATRSVITSPQESCAMLEKIGVLVV